MYINNRSIKTAIVGCGMISQVYLKTIVEQFSILNVVACTDRDENRRDACALQFGLDAFTLDEILEKTEIELIINLTNPASHYMITKKALLHGKHVYSEKMLATNACDGKELCELAEQKNRYLGAAPDTFLGGGLQTARYAIDTGLIGKPLSFIASISRNYDVLGNVVPHLWSREGSILFDMGCYYLTALVSLLGPIDKVTAFSKRNQAKHIRKRITDEKFGEVYDSEAISVVTASLLFKSGVTGGFHLNSDTIPDETIRFEIYGSEGIMTLGDPNSFGGTVMIKRMYGESFHFPATHGFSREARGLGAAEMAWAIRQNRPNRASKEMAYHVLETAEAIEKASGEGREVDIISSCCRPAPLPCGFIHNNEWSLTEESALALST